MTASAESPNQGKALGNHSPAEPFQATQASDAEGSASKAPRNPGNDEPPFALEPDLPTDGRDEVGEAMIRDLPQRPELSEPPSQPKPSIQQP